MEVPDNHTATLRYPLTSHSNKMRCISCCNKPTAQARTTDLRLSFYYATMIDTDCLETTALPRQRQGYRQETDYQRPRCPLHSMRKDKPLRWPSFGQMARPRTIVL